MFTLLIVTLFFAAPLLVSAWTDFNTMRIPNTVVLALFGFFFLTLPLHWQGVSVLGEHLAMFGTFFAAGFAMFAFGWLGGGDAKLMAATALWFGFDDALLYIAYTTMIGAVIAIFLMVTPKVVPVRFRTSAVGMKIYQGNGDMPYGLALAAGALLVWPQSQLGLALVG